MTLRAVLQGDEISLPSSEKDGTRGGFVRKKAPSAGVYWETANDCGFHTENEWAAVLTDLRMLKRNGRSAPAKFKGTGT